MKQFKFTLIVLGALILLLLAACGGGGDAPADTSGGGSGESISVVMNDIYYSDENDNVNNPPVWNVTSGSTVTVNMDNQGALEHSWAIVEAGAELPDAITDPAAVSDLLLFESAEVAGGSAGVGQFTAPAPGEYIVICNIAGHYPTMQGRLVVGE